MDEESVRAVFSNEVVLAHVTYLHIYLFLTSTL